MFHPVSSLPLRRREKKQKRVAVVTVTAHPAAAGYSLCAFGRADAY